MIPFRRAAVIGLGLVGGSLARDLAALGVDVVGYDAKRDELDAALLDGALTSALPQSLDGVEHADLIIVAVPVDATAEVLRRVAEHSVKASLIMDVGSTKAEVMATARRTGLAPRFVGSHPMAGDHRSGWSASRRGLFAGAIVYLCASEETSSESLGAADSLWRALGAEPTPVCANEHDRRLAWTSHMPHMLSIALSTVLDDAGVSRQELGPGGRDLTRLAGSSVTMWTAVARENRVSIAEAMDALEQRIAALRAAISAGASDDLAAHLAHAREWFDGGEPASGAASRDPST